jgi:hypothetical protein
MHSAWERMGQPDVEAMLTEIAARDAEAARLARQVWRQLEEQGRPETIAEWRETLAHAISSYQSQGRSRIKTTSQMRLDTLKTRGW